jgi:hypothetical protein
VRNLTTGQVAKFADVASRTVCKWFDAGKLKGYRIPGSNDRRIPPGEVLRFLIAHGMPVPAELAPLRVLYFGLESDEAAVLAALGAELAPDPIWFGRLLGDGTPVGAAVVGDAEGLGFARQAVTHTLSLHPLAVVTLVVSADVSDAGVGAGVRVLRRPFDWPILRELVMLREDAA